jgi:hypothetical protein
MGRCFLWQLGRFTPTDPLDHLLDLAVAILGHNDPDMAPDRLLGTMPVQPFSTRIPRKDPPIQTFRQDRVLGIRHDRG